MPVKLKLAFGCITLRVGKAMPRTTLAVSILMG